MGDGSSIESKGQDHHAKATNKTEEAENTDRVFDAKKRVFLTERTGDATEDEEVGRKRRASVDQAGAPPTDSDVGGLFSSEEVLPAGWKAFYHEEYKQHYYYNEAKGETSWTKPTPAANVETPSLAHSKKQEETEKNKQDQEAKLQKKLELTRKKQEQAKKKEEERIKRQQEQAAKAKKKEEERARKQQAQEEKAKAEMQEKRRKQQEAEDKKKEAEAEKKRREEKIAKKKQEEEAKKKRKEEEIVKVKKAAEEAEKKINEEEIA